MTGTARTQDRRGAALADPGLQEDMTKETRRKRRIRGAGIGGFGRKWTGGRT